MNTFLLKQIRQDVVGGKVGDLQVQCHPLRGLELQAGSLNLSSLLGLEIVNATDLGQQTLVPTGTVPDMVIRQNTIMVRYAPTTNRPVECQARWSVLPEGIFDLEVSTLTPGKFDDLVVQTRTNFATSNPAEEVHIVQSVTPGIVIYRPMGQQLSYVEFCHPHDGIGLDIKSDATTTTVRYRLFGHDLEKGVILRGRLRGMIIPRVVDEAASHAAYERFIVEAPNLTL